MKITRQQPPLLTIKGDTDTDLTLYAWLLIIVSLLILVGFSVGRATGQIPPLNQSGLVLRSGEPLSEAQISGTGIFFRLMYRIGRILSNPLRLVVVLALFGLTAGLIILIRPGQSKLITFDTAQQQVTVQRRSWFFRTTFEQYTFKNIADVRVERSTEQSGERAYRASLVLSVGEGAPLSNNYIQYTKVFPFSQSYRYSQEKAQALVHDIRAFLGDQAYYR